MSLRMRRVQEHFVFLGEKTDDQTFSCIDPPSQREKEGNVDLRSTFLGQNHHRKLILLE